MLITLESVLETNQYLEETMVAFKDLQLTTLYPLRQAAPVDFH